MYQAKDLITIFGRMKAFCQFSIWVAAVLLMAGMASCRRGAEGLKCDGEEDPATVGAHCPVFAWETGDDIFQEAYRVIVATSEKGLKNPDVWDSGMLDGNAKSLALTDSTLLESCRDYWWTVQISAKDRKRLLTGRKAHLMTGILREEDWTASEITVTRKRRDTTTFRFGESFLVGKGLDKACLYLVPGEGNNLTINGKQLDTTCFEAPGYTIREVSGMLRRGRNRIDVSVAPPSTSVKAELRLFYPDGTDIIASGPHWPVAPWTAND